MGFSINVVTVNKSKFLVNEYKLYQDFLFLFFDKLYQYFFVCL